MTPMLAVQIFLIIVCVAIIITLVLILRVLAGIEKKR